MRRGAVAVLALVALASCRTKVGPDEKTQIATAFAYSSNATRLCGTAVAGLKDVSVATRHAPDTNETLGASRAEVRGTPIPIGGRTPPPATCKGDATYVFNWVWVKGRSGPRELVINHFSVLDHAVPLTDVGPWAPPASTAPVAPPGRGPGPTPLVIGTEVTTALDTADAEVGPRFVAHDWTLTLPAGRAVAFVVIGGAHLAKGLGANASVDAVLLRDGAEVLRGDVGMLVKTFTAPSAGAYTLRVKRASVFAKESTYTIRTAFDADPMKLLAW